mgnify:CR=1 FL=1
MKYYDIHVNDSVNSYSTFMQVKSGLLPDDAQNEEIVELAKRIVKLIKDSGVKVQASIQGDTVRVVGAKRDVLQDTIAHVKKSVTDFPLQFGNFRD